MMVVSPAICGSIIMRCGTEEQKKQWLPGIADGTHLMAFGITEADAGSNSHQITTTATRDGDDWVLNGQKTFISGVDEAQSRSEEHTSELQSLMRISYAVSCFNKNKTHKITIQI